MADNRDGTPNSNSDNYRAANATWTDEWNLRPKRNPSLVRRISELFFRAQPDTGPGPTSDTITTESGLVSEGLVTLYDKQFKFDTVRKAIYRDVEDMDNSSEEISVALDTISDNVCTSEDGVQMSFQVQSDDSKVQDVLYNVIETCKLHTKIRPLVRNLIKFGDSFAEIVINGAGEITDLKQLPPVTMFRNEDLTGNLLLGQPKYDQKSGKVINGRMECAFEQLTDQTTTLMATFWPWQILHIRLNHDGFSPYGRSHLRVARVTWRKLKAIEESLIVGRLTRDILKLVFYVDTTGLSPNQKKQALTDFQNQVMQRVHVDGRRENPFSVMTDFFVSTGYVKVNNQAHPSLGKIDVIDPRNEGIHDITDIKYLHRKLLSTLRVPPAHMGFEEDINAKATLTQQDAQYVRWLREVQQIVGHGLEQLFDTALILAGMDPEQAEYDITWPMLNTIDTMSQSQAALWEAQADLIYTDNLKVIDSAYIQRHRFNMTDEEIEEIDERIQAATEAQNAVDEANAQKAHDRQVAITNAKALAGGFKPGKNAERTQSRQVRHEKGEDDLPPTPVPTQAPHSGVSQEVKLLGALLMEKTENIIDLEIDRVAKKYQNGHS